LKIVGKYPDNFHKIETIFSLVNLADTITFQLTEKPNVNVLTNIGYLDGENNIVHKVASFMMNKFKPHYGIDIYIDKHIPIAAGLGGGSSNAAYTILTLNDIWELEIEDVELHTIAAMFGSDLNFFLSRYKSALGTGRGERIEEIPEFKWDNILLVNPGTQISAKEGYSLFCESEQPDNSKSLNRLSLESLCNDLEPGVRKEYVEVDTLLKDLDKCGSAKSIMSGSGATCIGFFEDEKLMHEAAERFRASNYWVCETSTINGDKQCIQE